MKTRSTQKSGSNLLVTLTTVLLMILMSSCATKATFLSSSIVPAAEGSVSIKQDKNDNYLIRVSVVNLAQPEKLDPARNTYVVWMDTENDRTENIGKINSSSSLFSKTLKVDLKTVSSVKPTRVFITAENDAAAQYPADRVILTTRSF